MGRRGVGRSADDGVGKARREDRHDGAEQDEAAGQQAQQRFAVAERGARRPPDEAVERGRKGRRGIRRQHREARQRAVGQDRGDLQRDDKTGADHGGENLRHQPGAARADQAKQHDRDRDRDRRGRKANGDDHAERGKPAPAAADHENIDERRRQQQRHRDHLQRDRRDANRKHVGQRDRRRHDQIEIGAGIKHPRHRFDGLRQHQRPCQQDGRGDDDQGGFVQRLLQVGKAADHGVGRQVHDRGKDDQSDDGGALAPLAAGGEHRQPLAPCQPDFVPGKPGQIR